MRTYFNLCNIYIIVAITTISCVENFDNFQDPILLTQQQSVQNKIVYDNVIDCYPGIIFDYTSERHAFQNDILNEIIWELLDEFDFSLPGGITAQSFNYKSSAPNQKSVFSFENTIFFNIHYLNTITTNNGGRSVLAFELMQQLMNIEYINNHKEIAEEEDEYDSYWKEIEIRSLHMLSESNYFDLVSALEILKDIENSR